jgi:hypothetical protein
MFEPRSGQEYSRSGALPTGRYFGACRLARPSASVLRAFTTAWALLSLAEVSSFTGVYLPSIAWPSMWATFSATGALAALSGHVHCNW